MDIGDIILGEFSTEMYPVYGPGIIIVRGIYMRFSCRQYEILIPMHVISSVLDGIPSLAVHAIYEYKFAYRLVAFAIVVLGFGIIAYVRDKQ